MFNNVASSQGMFRIPLKIRKLSATVDLYQPEEEAEEGVRLMSWIGVVDRTEDDSALTMQNRRCETVPYKQYSP